jgi:hypothetical protein
VARWLDGGSQGLLNANVQPVAKLKNTAYSRKESEMTSAPSLRCHDQSMGYWLNEPAILNQALLGTAMTDLAREGYGIIRVIVRQTNFAFRSPQVISAVRTACAEAHRHGMRLVLDCEPHAKSAREMGAVYPGATGQRLYRGSGPLRDGRFRIDLQLPGTDGVTFDHIAACAVEVDGVLRPIPVPDCSLTWEVTMVAAGITDARQDYIEGKALGARRHICLRGEIPALSHGRVVIHVAMRVNTLVDFASVEARRWYRELIADYRDIPLDGICWDEPAVDGDWESYRYGAGFAKRFADMHGYALTSRLHLLDAGGLSAEAVRVRLDYYHTLNESLAEAQADMLAAARAAFGEHILTGNHPTWQGEGGINDYRAGAIDYFRLNDAMDAGYTDCCWWDAASVAYSYVLGSSLGRLTASGEAECNTWHWKPTNRSTWYNARLMSLMRITWFNIWYGCDADTAMYPRHYAWTAATSAMRRHQRWQRFLGAARPEVTIAVLHDWKGVCGFNVAHAANLHKAFCMNLSLAAQQANLAFDFIDERLLAASHVTDGKLCNDLGAYGVLVVPGAPVIGQAAWAAIQRFAAAGGQVLFAGLPPTVDDAGNDLTAHFAEMLGIAPVHAETYDAWFRAAGPLPGFRPQRFDLVFPLAGPAERIARDSEGEAHAVRSATGRVWWFSGYEPSTAVLQHLLASQPPGVACHSGSVLWRRYCDGDRQLLMLVSREDQELSGIIEWSGYRLRLAGGESACLVIHANGTATVHREDGDAPSAAGATHLLERIVS